MLLEISHYGPLSFTEVSVSFVHRDIRISLPITELMTMCDYRKKTEMMMKICGACTTAGLQDHSFF